MGEASTHSQRNDTASPDTERTSTAGLAGAQPGGHSGWDTRGDVDNGERQCWLPGQDGNYSEIFGYSKTLRKRCFVS